MKNSEVKLTFSSSNISSLNLVNINDNYSNKYSRNLILTPIYKPKEKKKISHFSRNSFPYLEYPPSPINTNRYK
jgi:hypothetical protein